MIYTIESVKKNFVVLITVSLIILFVLLIVINSFSKKDSTPDSPITNNPVPTTINFKTLITQRDTTNPTSIQLRNDTDLLSTDEQATLRSVQLSLPAEDSDIAIAYSPITDQFIVQKKTEKAVELFNLFLANNKLQRLYKDHPSYFVFTKNDLNTEVLTLENRVIDQLDDDDEAEVEAETSQPPKNSTVDKQVESLSRLFSLMTSFNFNSGTRAVSPSQTSPQPTTSTTPEESQIKSSIDLDVAAKASCYKFRMNKCGGSETETTGELRPGVTSNTYPIDKALVNELFSNPNAYGLRNRKWQFDAGMVHPKLVRFLNEFVKSNTLDKHLGIADGVGRCCARNGRSKAPAVGCRLTPHRLGVAIDLDTLNGSRVIKSERDDPGMRKAMDWINAQRGSLRPDSVTMSPIFAGLYPFHPDSGHADHLHLDFSRSLACQ